MAFYPGKAATFSVAGTAKPVDTVEFTSNGEEIDVTNFTSSGWRENEGGIRSVDITASGHYNGVGSGASASDFVGATGALVFDPDGAGSGTTALTVTCRITSFRITSDVRGVARANYTAVSTGVPTLVY